MKLSDVYSEYVTSNNLYDKYGIATVTPYIQDTKTDTEKAKHLRLKTALMLSAILQT